MRFAGDRRPEVEQMHASARAAMVRAKATANRPAYYQDQNHPAEPQQEARHGDHQ